MTAHTDPTLPAAEFTRNYAVTFGQQYPREPHPRWPYAHRDGYVTVKVPGSVPREEAEPLARAATVELLGTGWSMLYPAASLGVEFYPRGELAIVTVTAVDPFSWSIDDRRAVRLAEEEAVLGLVST